MLGDQCGDRGFKALKQTVKLHYKLGNYKHMMDAYREMLTYIKSAVTRNYSEKCINNILDFVSGSASQNLELLQEFYQTTLKALEEAKNEVGPFNQIHKKCKLNWHLSAVSREGHKHETPETSRSDDGLVGGTETLVQDKFEAV